MLQRSVPALDSRLTQCDNAHVLGCGEDILPNFVVQRWDRAFQWRRRVEMENQREIGHPDRTSAVVLMNAFYGESPGLRVPELIELFSNRELRALALHFLQSPQQFAWLIDFQRNLQPARSALLR
ncbi:hypothetical protein GCT13_39220 [Paraburkholderia sp. CNPSo 3157]|uniref:Uncharacterized protein n=1 Tax=Paraburkholderia franconis TaxID=2654983 RepID=A0A7X1NIM0_9BURK|nr:hypothetical protein [Paraburkholderia franconis]MPW22682.1 hypothetical protein [Paraburkholderia franconis]